MRMPARYRELSQDAIDAVFAEVEALGERTAAGLSARGELGESSNVVWKSTTRVTTMALRVLWTRCRLVVSGRTGTSKRYDTPERSLPRGSRGEGTKDFARWALLERVEAAGLLSMRAGPWWGTTGTARKSGLVQELVEAGQLTAVRRRVRRSCRPGAELTSRRRCGDFVSLLNAVLELGAIFVVAIDGFVAVVVDLVIADLVNGIGVALGSVD